MISFPMLKRNMGSIFRLGAIFLAIIIMYTVVIIYMFDPKLADMLDEYQKMMPGMMAAVGMTGNTGTLIEFMNTYLYGFIMTLIPAVFTIVLTNKLLMKYVDNGSLACILATPTSRGKLIFTQMISLIFGVALLIAITTAAGYGACEYFFPGELAVQQYIHLNIGVFLLQFAIAGITFCAACLFNDSKGYFVVGAGLPLIFYIIQMMANMGGDLENLKYATIYTLFDGAKIIEGGEIVAQYGIMTAIGVVLFLVGGVCFTRKDLPL